MGIPLGRILITSATPPLFVLLLTKQLKQVLKNPPPILYNLGSPLPIYSVQKYAIYRQWWFYGCGSQYLEKWAAWRQAALSALFLLYFIWAFDILNMIMKIQPPFCSISICVCGSKCIIYHQFEEIIKSYLLNVGWMSGWLPNSLSVQSFNSASVILNLSELPCPGGFPATFRLSVVPWPWRMIVSITVRLFLNGWWTRYQKWALPRVLKGLLGCSYVTWLWEGRRRFGFWWVWTSRWMTWLLQAGGGSCKQMVLWSPQWNLYCSWLGMSGKHKKDLLELSHFHVLPLSQTGGLWCNYMAAS